MKNLVYAMLFLFTLSSISVKAQSSFDKDMTKFHKDIFKTCGMIKSKEAKNSILILKSLAGLKAEIKSLEQKYAKNPPAEYAHDPMFASYFFQFTDVANILSERVKREDYKAAVLNCSGFCKTFNKMHMINGTLDLTDVMFMWYSQMSMTNFMINAGNTKGASMNAHKIPALYNMLIAQKNKKNSKEFNTQFADLDNLYQAWISAVNSKNFTEAQKQAKAFDALFPMVFKASL